MYKPQCVTPHLIINKYCLTMMSNGGTLTIFGKPWRITPNLINYFPITTTLERARHVSEEDLDNSYVSLDGVRENFFIYVPCGHCELCLHSKQIDFINRAAMETLTWDCPPFFFCLTYDRKHLPGIRVNGKLYAAGNLCYKHVQDFFKRLRINWTRRGIEHDIRYMVSGEYGAKRGRPHYHVILWNNPYHANELEPHLVDLLKKDIFEAWNMCSWTVFNDPDNFGQCRGGAVPYATKYVAKEPTLPPGRTVKPFIRCSSGKRGGLGSIYFKQFIPYLHDNPAINNIDYVDKRGRYQYMMISKTFSHKTWKSPSALVPARQKNLYREFIDVLQKYVSVDGMPLNDAFQLSEALRPSKYVRNPFRPPIPQITPDSAFSKFVSSRLLNVLDSLVLDLAECVDINLSDVDNYYLHKSFFVDRSYSSFAQNISKLREKNALILDKTSF